MASPLAGKRAFVTGAGRGIGPAMRSPSREGAEVLAASRLPSSQIERHAGLARQRSGGPLDPATADAFSALAPEFDVEPPRCPVGHESNRHGTQTPATPE